MIHGGAHEKSMTLVMAPTNVGKTLFLCSFTTAAILSGRKVLYVTFEDSEVKIGQRITQNLFDITQSQLYSLSKENYGKLWKKAIGQIGHNKLIIKEYSMIEIRFDFLGKNNDKRNTIFLRKIYINTASNVNDICSTTYFQIYILFSNRFFN